MRTKQVADKLRVSVTTIRNYVQEFPTYLSASANPQAYAEREFTSLDVELLGTLVAWKKLGITYDQIHEKLVRGDHLREDNYLSRDDENQQTLAAIQQYQRQVDALGAQITTLEGQNRDMQKQLNDAYVEIGRLKERLETGMQPSQLDTSELTALIRELRDFITQRLD